VILWIVHAGSTETLAGRAAYDDVDLSLVEIPTVLEWLKITGQISNICLQERRVKIMSVRALGALLIVSCSNDIKPRVRKSQTKAARSTE